MKNSTNIRDPKRFVRGLKFRALNMKGPELPSESKAFCALPRTQNAADPWSNSGPSAATWIGQICIPRVRRCLDWRNLVTTIDAVNEVDEHFFAPRKISSRVRGNDFLRDQMG